jgi:hypothetical protein
VHKFNHKFVEKIKLERTSINGVRHYVLPSGETVPLKSVTAALGEKLDATSEGLQAWKDRIGEEAAQRILTQASKRGDAVHKLTEDFLLNKENITKGHMPFNIYTFNQIKAILEKNVDDIYGIELPLYSLKLGLVGRADLVARFNSIPSIIDIKTARYKRQEDWIEKYFLQTSIYSLMFEGIYKIETPQIVLIIALDDDDPQLIVRSRNQYLKRISELFS